MKKLILMALISILPTLLFGQDSTIGGIHTLQIKNGYKSIKLGSNFIDLPREKISFLDNDSLIDRDSCFTYEYKDPELLKISSEITLNSIALKIYKGQVAQILLIFNREDGWKIQSVFTTAYGIYTNQANRFMDNYEWNSSSVKLQLRYETRSKFGLAIYSSDAIRDEIDRHNNAKENKAAKDL
jgi:hypothetical protein